MCGADEDPDTGVGQVISKVVLATHNAKKLAELRRIFAEADVGVEVVGLGEVAEYPEPEETEFTFEGNALLKARAAADATGLPALADDSGLEVDVLNKMPGVRSARWAGPGASDEENLTLLLTQLSDVPDDQRTARFVCAMALAMPDGSEHVEYGDMPGRMGRRPVGSNGFGYDPGFIADGLQVTNGELTPEQKDAISHRGKAVRAMAAYLAGMGEGS